MRRFYPVPRFASVVSARHRPRPRPALHVPGRRARARVDRLDRFGALQAPGRASSPSRTRRRRGRRAGRGRGGARLGPGAARRPGALARGLLRLDPGAGARARRAAGPQAARRCEAAARVQRIFAGEPRPDALTEAQERVLAQVVGALGRPAHYLLYGETGSGKTEVYLRACEAALERGPRRDRARPGDRTHPSGIRPLPRALRRSSRRPPLVPDRGGAARRARADRSRGRARGRRSPLGDLRPGRAPRADRRRRGAGLVLQAGIRPSLRRAHGRGQARCARGRGRPSTEARRPGPRAGSGSSGSSSGKRLGGLAPAGQGRRPAPRGGLPALGAAPRRARPALGRRRQGRAPPEPPRSGAGDPLPRLRPDLPLRPAATSPSPSTPTARLHCHHCGFTADAPDRCPACGVDRAGPPRRRHRAPRSRARRAASGARAVPARRGHGRAIRRSSATSSPASRATDRAVLLGTQMVAKGHHFAGVALAAVVDADAGLGMPDFRAEERTFQLVTQLAGRSGRDAPGRVLVQTYQPDARPIALAARHGGGGVPRRRARAPARARLPALPPPRADRRLRAGRRSGRGRSSTELRAGLEGSRTRTSSARRRSCASEAGTARSSS